MSTLTLLFSVSPDARSSLYFCFADFSGQSPQLPKSRAILRHFECRPLDSRGAIKSDNYAVRLLVCSFRRDLFAHKHFHIISFDETVSQRLKGRYAVCTEKKEVRL